LQARIGSQYTRVLGPDTSLQTMALSPLALTDTTPPL